MHMDVTAETGAVAWSNGPAEVVDGRLVHMVGDFKLDGAADVQSVHTHDFAVYMGEVDVEMDAEAFPYAGINREGGGACWG